MSMTLKIFQAASYYPALRYQTRSLSSLRPLCGALYPVASVPLVKQQLLSKHKNPVQVARHAFSSSTVSSEVIIQMDKPEDDEIDDVDSLRLKCTVFDEKGNQSTLSHSFTKEELCTEHGLQVSSHSGGIKTKTEEM